MIRGLVFDFDGLILDTETADFRSWQEVYEELDCHLPLEEWAKCIGRGWNWDGFNPYKYLEGLLCRPVDRARIETEQKRRFADLLAAQGARPGVEEYISRAKQLGLGLAIASSSPREWIDSHLARLGLLSRFDCVRCSGDAPRHKPEPDLYLAALEGLGLQPEEAIAFEDSPNGIRAAKRAGIFCVAVPNSITVKLDLDEANLRLASLTQMPLDSLLDAVGGANLQ